MKWLNYLFSIFDLNNKYLCSFTGTHKCLDKNLVYFNFDVLKYLIVWFISIIVFKLLSSDLYVDR